MDNKMVDNDTVNTIVDKLKYTRLLAGVGLATMILGVILPYIKYTTILGTLKVSLWQSWKGKIVLVLLIANAIFLFKDYLEKYIPSLLNVSFWKKISGLKYQYAMAPAITVAIFVILITMNLEVSFGLYNIGFYMFWLGVICIVLYLIINKGKAVMPDKSYVKQDETYDDLKNVNIQTNNVNSTQNNAVNNNVNSNNNITNNNVNSNYNNNAVNYGINQNNNMNYNSNSGHNNQNNTMNYNPNNINGVTNYNQENNTNISNGINYNQGNDINNNETNQNNNQNNNM